MSLGVSLCFCALSLYFYSFPLYCFLRVPSCLLSRCFSHCEFLDTVHLDSHTAQSRVLRRTAFSGPVATASPLFFGISSSWIMKKIPTYWVGYSSLGKFINPGLQKKHQPPGVWFSSHNAQLCVFLLLTGMC